MKTKIVRLLSWIKLKKSNKEQEWTEINTDRASRFDLAAIAASKMKDSSNFVKKRNS